MAEEKKQKRVIKVELDTRELKSSLDQLNKALDDLNKNFKSVQTSAGQYANVVKRQATSSQDAANAIAITSDSLGVAANSMQLATDNTEGLSRAMLALPAPGMTADMAKAGAGAALLGANLNLIKDIMFSVNKTFFNFRGGLLQFNAALGAAGGVAIYFGKQLEKVDNQALKATGTLIKLGGYILTGFSAAVTAAIYGLASLAQTIGTKVVNAMIRLTAETNKYIQTQKVLNFTVQAFEDSIAGGVGATQEWEDSITSLSTRFNKLDGDMRKAAGEIITVGTQLGLTKDQMFELLEASAAYTKEGESVFQTSVKMVQALNGQAQSVVALGIKLNETSVAQHALKRGIASNFKELEDGQKVQVRFHKLMEQATTQMGISEKAANTLEQQQAKLAASTQKLVVEFGKGAKVIEDLNVGAWALNKALSVIPGPIAQTTGFLTAFGGRVLQIGGILVKFSLIIFSVRKGFKLLDTFLKTQSGMKIFATQIPLVGKSLNQMIGNLQGTKVEIKGLRSLILTLKGPMINTLDNISMAFFGVKTNALTARTAIVGFSKTVVVRMAQASKAVLRFTAVLLTNPIVLMVSGITGALVLLYKALQTVEEQTGVFSTVWGVLAEVMSATSPIVEGIVKLFSSLADVILTKVGQAFGLLVAGLARIIRLGVKLASVNPFGIFSDEQVQRLRAAERQLGSLDSRLKSVGFNIFELDKKVDRSPGGKMALDFNKATEEAKKLNKELGKTEKRATNFGESLTFAFEKFSEKADDVFGNLQDTFERAFDGASDAMADFVTTGKADFKGFAQDLIKQLAKIAIQKAIVQAISLFAKGGAFVGGVQKFAAGGVVNKPTIFPMANGMGLMGEKGPEAVMPLSRDAQGNLGVSAEGMGGANVTVNVVNQSGSETEQRERKGPGGEKIIDIIVKKAVNDGFSQGSFDKALQGSFGISRRGVI